MGLREVRIALVAAVVAGPAIARADADLNVVRADDLPQCPDAAQLRRVASPFVAPSAAAATHAYRVVFMRFEGKLRAEIVDETAGRIRRLEDSGIECAPLGQAVAVVLATMWSSEKSQPEPPPALPPPPPPPPPRAPPPIAAPSPRWQLAEGAALAIGLIRPATAAMRLDGGIHVERFSLRMGVLWLPEQRIEVAPGAVTVQLISGDASGCAFLPFRTELGLCANVYGGGIFAAGTGYSANASRSRPWFAIGPEAFIDGPLLRRWLRYRVAAAAIVPLHAETFAVGGVGAAYDTPPVGALFSLSIEQGD
jgi:hypothetical protein